MSARWVSCAPTCWSTPSLRLGRRRRGRDAVRTRSATRAGPATCTPSTPCGSAAARAGSTEPDYQSAFAHLRGEIELGQRNTVLALNLASGRDSLSNEGAQSPIVDPIEGILWTGLGSLSVSQVLTPLLVGQLTYDSSI
jgi:hypothetical protein